MRTTAKNRHPSQRPPQFNHRPPSALPLELVPSTCTRRHPCGVCDRCDYDAAAYTQDHPFTIGSVAEVDHL